MCRRVQSAKLWLLGPRQLNTNGPSIVQRWVCGNCTLDPVTTPGVVRNRGLSRLAGLTADQRDHLSQMLSAGPNPQRTPEDWRGAAARGEQCASTLAASGLGAVPQTLGPRRQALQGCSLFRGSVLWSTGSLELRGLVRDRTRLRPNLETISLGR